MMRTRLERDVDGGATGPVPRFLQRMDFCMRQAGTLMPTCANDFSILRNDATYTRIGAGTEHPQLRQLQGLRHGAMIVDGIHGQ